MIDPMPNVRHLLIFSSVAQLGSVSAASRAAHLSQPAVTQAIASLERNFDRALFARTAQGMVPTEAGRLCVERINRTLQRITEAVSAVAQSRDSRELLHGITSRQLQALVAVVESGGFGAAARAQRTTRATLHRPAKELE